MTASDSPRLPAERRGESDPSTDASADISVEELRRLVALLDLVPVPEHLEAQVLARVRGQRASMRRFRESGIDVSATPTSQPFRV